MSSILIKKIGLKGDKKDILIIDNIISKIGDDIDYNADKVISGKGKEAIPSFVNMHTHTGMNLLRGFEEDIPLFNWLTKVWEVEAKLDGEMVYWGTKLACLEMIKTGTTSFADMYWFPNDIARAVKEMGLRASLSYGFLDMGDADKAALQREECLKAFEDSKKWGEGVKFSVALHAPYTVCDENILWLTDFARANDLMLQTHISETQKENVDYYDTYRMSPTKRFSDMGVLGKNVVAAHCVWLNDEDIELLGRNKVTVVHNINSNLKLSSGYKFKYLELKNAGANITIGTDGAASSNNLDILEAMKTSALLQKAWRNDPSALPMDFLMDMATINGAKAMGNNSGKIEEGALADMLLVDVNSYAFVPNLNFMAALIYSANSSCVDTVICNGKVVMENRVVPGEQEILDNVHRIAEKLFKK